MLPGGITGQKMDLIKNWLEQMWSLLQTLGWWTAVGLVLCVAVQSLLSCKGGRKKEWVCIFLAVVGGALLPTCNFAAIAPSVMVLRRGAGTGTALAFLAAATLLNPAGILLAYGYMGPVLASAYVCGAAVLALLAGFAGKCCPGLETARTGVRRLSFPQAVGETFGVFEMELAFRVVLGILAEAVLLAAVPSGLWQNALADPGSISFLESAAMGIFRHVCIPDDVSLAASLAAAGLRPGGVVLFLMMGVCTNLPELSVLWGMAGKKTAALYGGITAAGSVSLAALTELTIGKGFAPRFNLADAGMFTQLAGLLSIRTWIPARVPCALGVFVLSVCGFRNRMRNKA